VRGALLYQSKNVGLFGQVDVDYSAAAASYSADTIGMSGTLRRPFWLDGEEWVCVSTTGRGHSPYVCSSISIYKLALASKFEGATVTYAERCIEAAGDGERWRGTGCFYHGMRVKHGGRALVLVGPEYELLAEPVVIHDSHDTDEEEATVADEDWELEPEELDAADLEECQDSLFDAPVPCESEADEEPFEESAAAAAWADWPSVPPHWTAEHRAHLEANIIQWVADRESKQGVLF
jgi:hypothetical protein